ncbi:MAG TPA: fimbrillin family protein [Actinomycetota bacterium]
MLRARAFALATLLFAACSTGETQVEGGGTPATGPTASGPTATGPTATGPTGETAAGEFDGPVSVDTQAQSVAGLTAAFYSCDGVNGVWTYTVQGGPFDFDVDSTVDMEGGTGTLVISEDFTVEPLGNISFTDTIDLVIAGTADAPVFRATSIDVKIDSAAPGLDQIAKSFFKKNTEVPILAGAKQC